MIYQKHVLDDGRRRGQERLVQPARRAVRSVLPQGLTRCTAPTGTTSSARSEATAASTSRPKDAAWLFEWTDPFVPAEWHGSINKERGTVVYIHG